jgi:hypothetical protein
MMHEQFRHDMQKHSDERDRLALLAEQRVEIELRDLTDYQKTAMLLALSDAHVVEALRVAAWRSLGAKEFIPRAWPLHITAELSWRYENLEMNENGE